MCFVCEKQERKNKYSVFLESKLNRALYKFLSMFCKIFSAGKTELSVCNFGRRRIPITSVTSQTY